MYKNIKNKLFTLSTITPCNLKHFISWYFFYSLLKLLRNSPSYYTLNFLWCRCLQLFWHSSMLLIYKQGGVFTCISRKILNGGFDHSVYIVASLICEFCVGNYYYYSILVIKTNYTIIATKSAINNFPSKTADRQHTLPWLNTS